MSQERIQTAIKDGKMICPKCKSGIQKFERYAETIDAVRDGFNVSNIDSRASRVTLTCGNAGCPWTERTEYWEQYIID